jgi:uncharacterized phage infection (PIP) family protein YhgE
MPRMSKLDRMAQIESTMGEFSFDDYVSIFEDLAGAAQNAQDAIEAIVQSAQTAVGHHEEREWEERNEALSELPDHLAELESALDTLDDFDQTLIATLKQTVSQAREAMSEASSHAGVLVAA